MGGPEPSEPGQLIRSYVVDRVLAIRSVLVGLE